MARAFARRERAEVADVADKRVYGDSFFALLGSVDLLISSIPCVGFSALGKRQGLEHDGTAIFVRGLTRFVRRSRPKLLVSAVAVPTVEGASARARACACTRRQLTS